LTPGRLTHHGFRRTSGVAGCHEAERGRDAAQFVQPTMGDDNDLDRLAATGYFFQRSEAIANFGVKRAGKTRAHARELLGKIIHSCHALFSCCGSARAASCHGEVKSFCAQSEK
jgi:hypothetical protein